MFKVKTSYCPCPRNLESSIPDYCLSKIMPRHVICLIPALSPMLRFQTSSRIWDMKHVYKRACKIKQWTHICTNDTLPSEYLSVSFYFTPRRAQRAQKVFGIYKQHNCHAASGVAGLGPAAVYIRVQLSPKRGYHSLPTVIGALSNIMLLPGWIIHCLQFYNPMNQLIKHMSKNKIGDMLA